MLPTTTLSPEVMKQAIRENCRRAALASAAAMTPEQRSDRSRRASITRWAKVRKARKEQRKQEIQAAAAEVLRPVSADLQ